MCLGIYTYGEPADESDDKHTISEIGIGDPKFFKNNVFGGWPEPSPVREVQPNLPTSVLLSLTLISLLLPPIILLYLLFFNSAISFSATALLLIIYSCIGIIVRCAV